MNIEDYKKLEPYSLDKSEKKKIFENLINSLTLHHYNNSKEYKKILDFFDYKFNKKQLNEIPFLPAKLFKQFELKSISKEKTFKTLYSSGTTNSVPSKIYLDKENAHNQMKALAKIMSTILGNTRLPMLIVDQNPKVINREVFNARSVAIYGFSTFGKNHTYLLDDEGEIDYNLLNDFLDSYGNTNFFIFGFTSVIFENLVKKERNIKFILMYGQTEASPRISYLEWKKFSLKFGSIGKVLSRSKFKILDKKGKNIKGAYLVGELVYFGKNVCLGYANNLRDLYKGDINKGKLFTGDLVYRDDDNYLFITGRKNRISKIFGLRIDLDQIEKQLKKNNYKVKCVSDNKYLKILIKNDYNSEKIKKIVQDLYGINKNFIFISKVKQFTNPNSLKDVITLN